MFIMAIARLSAVVLSLHLLQGTIAQQLILGNTARGITNIIPSATSASVSNSKNCNQNPDSSGNTGPITKSNKSNGQTGLQQFLKLQQPVVTPQKSLNFNVQQPTINQNLQQSVLNQKRPINQQHKFQSLPLNLQSQLLQQQETQTLQKQCTQAQQQSLEASISDSPQGRKPSSSLRITGISLAPLPVNNGQSRNLPLQVSEEASRSNLGLPSNLPYFVPNPCDCVHNTVDQISVVASPPNNVPISVVERTQCPAIMPTPISTSSLSTDCSNLKFPIELTSSIVPASTLPQHTVSAPIQSIDLASITTSTEYKSPLNQALLTQSQQPLEVVQMAQPVKYQMPSNQVELKSVELDVSHTPPMVEGNPPSNEVQYFETKPVVHLQRQPHVQNQQIPNSLPIMYPAPYVIQNNHGRKSSSIKTLLPLLLNLLKERNGGCHCPPNYNCGCMNINPSNPVNYSDSQIPAPQVFGYTNQINSQEEPPTSNDIILEEPRNRIYVPERSTFRDYNDGQDYSEEDDDEYVYDNED